MTDPLGTSTFLAALSRTRVEDHEHAMDALFTDYDFRHREPDPQQDADDERYAEQMHGPVMGGGEPDERAE